jgi:hypothetical protein
MSTMHQARRLVFGSTVVIALTLLAPVAVTAEDEVAVMAPVAAPSVDDTSVDAVRAATHALAAQRALLSGDIGSLQDEALFAILAASTTAEPTRVLAVQHALLSPNLGSLQEEALTALVAASSAEVEP